MIQFLRLRSWIREVKGCLKIQSAATEVTGSSWANFLSKTLLFIEQKWMSIKCSFLIWQLVCLFLALFAILWPRNLHSECKLWNENRHFFIRGRIRRVETASRRPHSCWRGNSRDLRRRLRKRRGRARRDSAWATIENSRNCPRSKVRREIGCSVHASSSIFSDCICSHLITTWKVSGDIIGEYYLAPPTWPRLHQQKRKVVSEVD